MAFEDSQNGLVAARAAGLATVITRNSFTMDHDFHGARVILDSLATTDLAAIRNLHEKR
jgi:beta-phosphoglucomutase-like phosphatase (HAD superfamily)